MTSSAGVRRDQSVDNSDFRRNSAVSRLPDSAARRKLRAMLFTHDISGCRAAAIGAHGLTDTVLEPVVARTAGGLDRLRADHGSGALPLLSLPGRRDDLAPLERLAEAWRTRFDTVVILGTGGSSLGGQALYALADYGFGPASGTPRLVFMDNIDPDGFASLDAAIDPDRTGVIVISKSGGTAETLTQATTLLPRLAGTVGDEAMARHALAISEPGDNPLRRLAARWDLPVLDHDPGVGGRFAAFSVVGLLPALIAGLDATAVREGAEAVLDNALGAALPADVPPAIGAALNIALLRGNGVGTAVMLPYLDRLRRFAAWHGQLWAESLGKQGAGTTPVAALGTVDQHSQLQLWLDGPRDKLFTVLTGPQEGAGATVDAALAESLGIDYLAGRTMGDLMAAEQQATIDTLVANGRPTRVMALKTLDAATLGALMMHFMLETLLAAHLFEVDAFDQPAVEQGKVLARKYLREGRAAR
jgi:glucose-6-phosphate isomerase